MFAFVTGKWIIRNVFDHSVSHPAVISVIRFAVVSMAYRTQPEKNVAIYDRIISVFTVFASYSCHTHIVKVQIAS